MWDGFALLNFNHAQVKLAHLCFFLESNCVSKVTQCYIIIIVAALNVKWATDRDWPLTSPVGKTRRNAYKIVCTSKSIHTLPSFSSLCRIASMQSIIALIQELASLAFVVFRQFDICFPTTAKPIQPKARRDTSRSV